MRRKCLARLIIAYGLGTVLAGIWMGNEVAWQWGWRFGVFGIGLLLVGMEPSRTKGR